MGNSSSEEVNSSSDSLVAPILVTSVLFSLAVALIWVGLVDRGLADRYGLFAIGAICVWLGVYLGTAILGGTGALKRQSYTTRKVKLLLSAGAALVLTGLIIDIDALVLFGAVLTFAGAYAGGAIVGKRLYAEGR